MRLIPANSSIPGPRHPRSVLLVLAVLLLGLLSVPETALGIKAGDPAPRFTLLDLENQVQALSDMGGHVVVLYFLGHNADVCRAPATALQNVVGPAYEARGLKILGIDCWNGTAEQLRQFRTQAAVTFPLLMMGQSTAVEYDLAYNSIVVIDGKGIVRYVSAGPDAGAFDLAALDRAIHDSLEEAAAVTNATWGVIKSLYGGRRRVLS